jgi:tetratricopeptide (TPR) repeat protein
MSRYDDLLPQAQELMMLIGEDEAYHDRLAETLIHLGWGYIASGTYDKAQFNFERAYRIHQTLENEYGMVRALHGRGTIAFYYGDKQLSKQFQERALALSIKINDKQGMADSYVNLGIVSYLNDAYRLAIDHSHRALAIFSELGEIRGIGMASNNLAMYHEALGEYDQAETYYQQSIDVAVQVQDRRMELNSYLNLGFLQLRRNPYSIEARQKIYHVLLLNHHIPNAMIYLEAVSGLAYMYYYDGDLINSAKLVGCLKQHPHATAELSDLRLNPLIELYKRVWDEAEFMAVIDKGDELDFNTLATDAILAYAIYG